MFRNKLDVWKDVFNMHISFDKIEDKSKVYYDGKEGFVTSAVSDVIKSNENTIVFICGPPIMISKVAEILLNKGFNEDQIYISAERLMYCGVGKCGRCMIHGKYTCLDGAVFRYDELKDYKDDWDEEDPSVQEKEAQKARVVTSQDSVDAVAQANVPVDPANVNDLISQAMQDGDWQTSSALKAEKLKALMEKKL